MTPEIHAVIIWSNALPQQDRIVADLAAQVGLVASYRIEWPPERFAENLARLYGAQPRQAAMKAHDSGRDPFLLLVVRDPAPHYESRARSSGSSLANTKLYDAKQRYRAWTDGDFRVHTTIDEEEADHDLFLLLGRHSSEFADAPVIAWSSEPELLESEVIGAGGWASKEQLLNALGVVCRYIVLSEEPLRLLVPNRARAEQLLGSDSGVELYDEDDDFRAGRPRRRVVRLARRIRRRLPG